MIAIDFGTSNTVVTRWNTVTQQPEIISLSGVTLKQANNPPLIPSLVYVKNAAKSEVIIGQNVRDRGLELKNNQRFFRGFKRGIGAEIQGFLPELDGETITFEQLGEWFLSDIINRIKTEVINNDELESLILTVPVDSFEIYRNWLGKICQSLPVKQVRIIDEPTAVALGYGMREGGTLLVIDFGGGTLDLSLVKLDEKIIKQSLGFILKWGQKDLNKNAAQKAKTAKVLAKIGQNLGGGDLDIWIADYLVKNQGVQPGSLINRLAERLKIKLSSQIQATEVYFDDENLASYELTLNRDIFAEILERNNLFKRLDDVMIQLLQQARRQGIETSDIDGVLLVGGTMEIPALQKWVEKYFEPSIIKKEKPFQAIAEGALQLTQGVELQDFLYHSYGVRYWDRKNNRHNWHSIIKSGQPYPMEKPLELILGASVENQPSIELIIGELGAEISKTEIYFEGDRLITKQLSPEQTQVKLLNDREGARTIAKLDPVGNPGSDRIKLSFTIDQQCFLRLTVQDLLTNQILLDNQAVVQLS